MYDRRLVLACALALGLSLVPVGPVAGFTGGGSSTSTPKDSDLRAGRKAVDAGDFNKAIEYLDKAVKAKPNSADGYNLLGYSYRKLGDVDKAFTYYRMALERDRNHRGANEYIGELYLEIGDLAKAEEHLKILDGACFFGCEEYTELKNAIKAYKASRGS
ncbi:MAG: tetratricopeptide repeat protein [Proteobacteria bacterium]|nr:tetratricopeptide repeat protein [Pseudomonadota bacterium]